MKSVRRSTRWTKHWVWLTYGLVKSKQNFVLNLISGASLLAGSCLFLAMLHLPIGTNQSLNWNK